MSDIETENKEISKENYQESSQDSNKNTKTDAPKNRKIGIVIPFILILSLSGIGVLGYLGYQAKKDLKRLRSGLSQSQVLEKEREEKLEQDLATQKQQEAQDTQKLQEQINAQATQLHQLSDKHDWHLSEALYLVSIAQERLTTVGDIPTVIKLLKTADDRLQSLGDARAIPVRASVAKDITRLEASARFDKIGLWVEAGNLRSKIDSLSFHNLQASIEGQPDIVEESQAKSKSAEQPAWREALDKTWEELKGLVRVREFNSEKLSSSLTPREQTQLLRAMDLMLVEAQWGVLQEEPRVYQHSLEMIEDRLNTYFIRDDLWKTVSVQIKELKTKTVKPEPLDLSNTLQLMNKLAKNGEQPS